MIPLTVTPDVDRAPWHDLADRIHPDAVSDDRPMPHLRRIGLLRNGMASGRASVAIAVELGDGRVVLAETSYRLWRVAVAALAAAAEEPLDD